MTDNRQRTIRLEQLLKGIVDYTVPADIVVSGLSCDSRSVKEGELFIARTGHQDDGVRYIEDAFSRGAVAALAEQSLPSDDRPIFKVEQLENQLPEIVDQFFGKPDDATHIVGFTGTNGKTSCALLTARAMRQLGHTSAVVGTLGAGLVDGDFLPLGNTTPDRITISRLLDGFVNEHQADVIAMEVSSHALVQGRVSGLNIRTAVFTNLSHEHLDYHGSMAAYAQAKFKLFLMPSVKQVVINLDDPYAESLIKAVKQSNPTANIVGYASSLEHEASAIQFNIDYICVQSAEFSLSGIQAELLTSWGKIQLNVSLLGEFNLMNCLAVLGVLMAEGVSLDQAILAMSSLEPITGRLELASKTEKPAVYIDYAHTPDALEKVLQALKPLCPENLWAIFGCGGDRDKAKRPEMARVAEQLADKIVVTDDNPRGELSESILDGIRSGFTYPEKVTFKSNRKEAIAYAINTAVENDVVLIAGKGHEDYQLIRAEDGSVQSIPFSDIAEAKACLAVRKERPHVS